ncbi:MAG: hypothetical protein HOV81_42755 [Kofleriaceae bacterium]|nr:hypothetical protein [Kofleriaceae bacterium]
MSSSWALRELIDRTKPHHADADLVQLQLLGGASSTTAYRQELAKVYGFEKPLQVIFATQDLHLCGSCPRTRMSALHADLAALGLSPSKLPVSTDFRVTSERARVLGWFFVAERTAFLSTLLLRRLKKQLAWDVFDSATAYLSSCSMLGAARWRDLGKVLDDHVSTPEVFDEITAGAEEAFASQRRWFGSFRSWVAKAS